MANDRFWQTKLRARLHDPGEKALVLMRDPAGHEGGTSRALHRLLGFDTLPESGTVGPASPDALDTLVSGDGVPVDMYRTVQRADWWASAADRPQWPLEEVATSNGRTRKVADWAQVRWTGQPTLIHPLSGRSFNLNSLSDTDFADIKDRSRKHFERLIVKDRDGTGIDWRRTLLAYWRFGPELREDEDDGKLGSLWPLLPADTRVPDHSIWDHLDLVSTFAGAFTRDRDGEAALLALSIGPVQSFIAAARTTSDLWAGSHLLSQLSWEAAKVVCERFGPDAVLFPRLRGIPLVDVWLRDECGLPRKWFAKCPWTWRATDSNPLFSAALPNRFVAVVPASDGRETTEEIETRVRSWLRSHGDEVVDRLLEAAGFCSEAELRDESVHAYGQMRAQLDGFPEVHWAAVPFSLIRPRDRRRQTDLDTSALSEAMTPFFGAKPGVRCGFLDSPAWMVLQEDCQWEDRTTFFAPNPGVLYPAVYDLAERVLAAAKAVRPFEQTRQHGWRCSLTGETEWLTTEPSQLERPYRQQADTLWTKIATAKPAWAKEGEYLGALPAVKRLWPTLFAEQVGRVTGADQSAAARFVVSTHTMAMAGDLNRLDGALRDREDLHRNLEQYVAKDDRAPALPRSLANLRNTLAARIPAALDRLRESDEGEKELEQLERGIKELLGHGPETYYALLLLDGDHMGRILSGDEQFAISYRDSFHPQVRTGIDRHAQSNQRIHQYGRQKRAVSPNRHLAISAALNDFALWVVPEVVEREHRGRVIFAGGDDVLAMLPVADLLPAMRQLRHAYSGTAREEDQETSWRDVRRHDKLVCREGFAYLNGRLMRMMGERATASCGAVIAHHQTPLAAVMRELRTAEQRAKTEGGRNAFSLTVMKRSGGALTLTAKWEVTNLLREFREFFGEPGVSRRAVYHSLVWLRDLPTDAGVGMLGTLLGYQLARQTAKKEILARHDVPGLARRLTELSARQDSQQQPRRWLETFLSVAEFLAREVRASGLDAQTRSDDDPVDATQRAAS